MNILVVAPRYPPEGGGLEIYVKNLCEGLVAKGHEITVLCSTYSNKDSVETFDNLKIIRQVPDFTISNTPFKFSLFSTIVKLLKEQQFDCVNAHLPVVFYADMAMFAAKTCKVPCVLTYHSSGLFKGKLWIDMLAGLYQLSLGKVTLCLANKITAVSDYVKQNTLKKYIERVSVVYPSIVRKEEQVGEIDADILFVGQLCRGHEIKGLDILLLALSELKKESIKFTLKVVGGGNQLEEYKVKAKEMGLQEDVLFAGVVDNSQIGKHYLKSRFVVVPSYGVEAFSIVCLEAAFYSKAVLASRVGGIPEIVEDKKTGLLIRPKDATELAAALKEMLLLSDRTVEMGKLAREKYDSGFSYDEFVEETEKQLAQLC